MDKMIGVEVGVGSLEMSDPAVAARSAFDEALAYCAQKMNLVGPQSALDLLRMGHASAQGYFQYALAGHVAEYLASFDGETRAVYLYDDEATPDDVTFAEPQPVSPLHLIVWARRKTEALYSLVAALYRAIANVYAERAGLPHAAHLLDAQVIDDTETQRGTGYAAMLNSIHHKPVLIWQR